MSRSSKSNRNANANDSSLGNLLSVSTVPAQQVEPSLAETLYDAISDLRRYHPQTLFRAPHAAVRKATRSVIGPGFAQVRAALPDRIGICVRRKIRREVLFALNIKSRGRRGGGKRRHRNQYSKVHC